MQYIKKETEDRRHVSENIEKIIGKKYQKITTSFNGEIIELEIDDTGLSATKKKELQNYIDTLEEKNG